MNLRARLRNGLAEATDKVRSIIKTTKDLKDQLKNNVQFLIAFIIILVILVLVDYFTRRGLRIIEVFGVLSFSGLLVWVNARQTKLMELERTPHLEVSDYEFGGKEATIYLKNSGGGLVEDLKLVTRAAIQEEGEGEIKPLPDAEISLKKISKESGRRRLEDSIPGGDSSVFKAEPLLSRGEEQPFEEFYLATDSLRRNDVRKLGFKLYVSYKTELGEVEEEEVFGYPRVIDLTLYEDGLDIDEAWGAGGLFEGPWFQDYL